MGVGDRIDGVKLDAASLVGKENRGIKELTDGMDLLTCIPDG